MRCGSRGWCTISKKRAFRKWSRGAAGGGPISGTQEPENEEPCPAWAVSYLRITCVPEMGGRPGAGPFPERTSPESESRESNPYARVLLGVREVSWWRQPASSGRQEFCGGPLNCLSAWGCFIWCGSQKRDQKKDRVGIEPRTSQLNASTTRPEGDDKLH